MYCPLCKKKTVKVIDYINPHVESWFWECKVHGLVKTQYVVDGSVQRNWVVK